MKINNKYVKGAGELHKKLTQMSKQAPAATAAAIYGGAQIVMEQARANAPVDEGWLRSGGYVTKPSASTRGKAEVEMGFGGAAEEYLVYQHTHHATKSLYFLRAIQQKAREAEAYIARFMDNYFANDLKFRMPEKRVPEDPTEEMGPIKTTRHGRHG